MATDIASSVILSLLVFSLIGCAFPSFKSARNDKDFLNDEYVEALSELKVGELLNYQQQKYQLDDPLGDHALLTLLHLTATDIVWLTVTGQGYDEILDDISKWRSGFEYHPVGLDRFSGIRGRKPGDYDSTYRQTWSKNDDVFMGIISQEEKIGVLPKPGICHRWSSAYRNNPQIGTFPYMLFSKLFWALGYGESSVYFVTEKEEQLAQWIVDQELRSVTLNKVFRKSYQLNSGDVYLSLLTATNVFSRFWYLKDRETLSIATRLKLITAEQNWEEDNFGAWHHFWGMVLFGYCHGTMSSRLVGWIESMGSHRVSAQAEIDEDYINKYAGRVGVELRKKIEHWSTDEIAN